MALHFAARMHAFVHDLFRSSNLKETRRLYDRVARLFDYHALQTDDQRERLFDRMAAETLAAFDVTPAPPQFGVVRQLIERLFADGTILHLPRYDWQDRWSVTELWELRDALNAQRAWLEDWEGTYECVLEAAIAFLSPLYAAYPQLLTGTSEADGITFQTHLIRSLGDPGPVIEEMMQAAYADDVMERNLLLRLRVRLDRNLIAASGGNPDDPEGFRRALKWPTQSDIKNPEALVGSYLGGTPLLDLLNQNTRFTIPSRSRFEHQMINAGSGHGKTQTLQYFIGQDLAAMETEKRTVIVLDSQGDLIRTISNLAVFAPGGALHDRLVVIDPTDVEWPVSLNLFDVGIDRLAGYAPLERERLTNSILELYDFVLGTLLAAEMTQKQNVIFRYVTRLMLHIPDATIHTLRELMEPGSEVTFAEHIAKLSGTAKHFFETEFASKEFEQTKKQVLRRLWGILENQTFERMFSHPRSKLDLFGEMNAGKVILVNTAKDLLKETGTEIFGRFFIALIAQAAQERATLAATDRTPTTVYIDELVDYVHRNADRNLAAILAQARKYNVGMVVALQYLGQLDTRLQDAFAANTSIKMAGGVSAKDARSLAPMLYCDPGFIEDQPTGSFATYVRGVTPQAVPLQIPFGTMEGHARMSVSERDHVQNVMRERYAVHYTELNDTSPKAAEGADATEVEDDQPATEDSPPRPTTDPSSDL